MTYEIIRELLSVRGIEHPYSFFGEKEWDRIHQYFKHTRKTEGRLAISSIRHFAELLDVTPSFLVACIKYEDMEEGLWIWKNFNRKSKE